MHVSNSPKSSSCGNLAPFQVSVQRKATKAWTFTDGSLIPKGNLVAVPQQSLMRDPTNYPNPMQFDPTRYLARDEDGRVRSIPRFTDVKWSFPYWGGHKRAW